SGKTRARCSEARCKATAKSSSRSRRSCRRSPRSPNPHRSADMATQRYELGIDAAKLDAIDMHVHLEVDGHGHESLPPALTEASAKYFKAEDRTPSLDRI